MSTKRESINPREASVAATFYEPTYQRLRHWRGGQQWNLLCFVHPASDEVKNVMRNCGAAPTRTFRSPCFAEIWKLPQDILRTGPFRDEPTKLDQQITESLGCQAGRYSAAVGHLQWGDIHDERHLRRRVESKLLAEASRKNARGR